MALATKTPETGSDNGRQQLANSLTTRISLVYQDIKIDQL